MTGHMHMQKGKRVIVFLKQNDPVIGKFLKYDDDQVFLEGEKPIPSKRVRTVSYYKQTPETLPPPPRLVKKHKIVRNPEPPKERNIPQQPIEILFVPDWRDVLLEHAGDFAETHEQNNESEPLSEHEQLLWNLWSDEVPSKSARKRLAVLASHIQTEGDMKSLVRYAHQELDEKLGGSQFLSPGHLVALLPFWKYEQDHSPQKLKEERRREKEAAFRVDAILKRNIALKKKKEKLSQFRELQEGQKQDGFSPSLTFPQESIDVRPGDPVEAIALASRRVVRGLLGKSDYQNGCVVVLAFPEHTPVLCKKASIKRLEELP